MLNSLIQISLKKRQIVLFMAMAICLYGGWLLRSLPVDVFPNLNRPTVTVLTEAHGLAPEEVETLVTLPIEGSINGLPGLLRLRSSSGIGISIIHLEFDWGTDIFRNRQLVSERLQLLAGRLPKGLQPTMGPITSIMGEIQFVGISSPDNSVSLMDLRSLADWTIRPRLMTVPGIGQAIVMGGEVKQFQILVSSERLQKKSISLEDLKKALSEISENTTGGFVALGEKEFLIRPLGRANGIEEIRNSVVSMHFGQPVFVKDIAEVSIGPRIKRGEASINGKHAVLLTIQKQPNASTIELTKAIDKELNDLEKSLPAGVRIEKDLFKQSHFIESAIGNVRGALVDGILMVVVVLFLFLMNFRTTAITLVAIPLSLLITAIVFHLFDITINTMTLGGLAIAIGELVDDAIVDVENVFRRLRENKKLQSPKSALTVVYEASREVRNSIVMSTVIVVLVFLPLFALGGIEGRLFVPLGIAYIVSIIASLLVSLTVTPVLCSFLLPPLSASTADQEGKLVRFIKAKALKILNWTLPRPGLVLTLTGLLLVFSLILLPFMGNNFLPQFNEGTATIGVGSVPGISLPASDELGFQIEKAISSVPEVKSTVRRTGRAEMDEHAEGVHWHEIDVDFNEKGRPRSIVLSEIRDRIEKVGNVYVNIGQPIGHRLDHLLSGVRAQLAIKIFGTDLAELRRLGGEVFDAIEPIEGIVDLQTEALVLAPQLKISIDREASAGYGIRAGSLAKDLEIALNGETVAQIIEGQRMYDVFVRLDDQSRASPENLADTLVKFMPTGQSVKLSDVANIYQGTGVNLVNHEGMLRRFVVSANIQGRDLGSVVEEVQRKVSQVKLGEGYFIKFGGQFESQKESSRRILWLGLLSLLCVFAALYFHFGSALLSLQVMMNVPLALIGSVTAIYLTERTLSVATLVAFVTLCGIATRNGILLISHYLHLMKSEGEKFDEQMVIRGSLERIIPVLMTASTAALALVPLLLARGEPGKEILYPVSVVVVGGLVSSTFLDLVVTPTVFLKFAKRAVLKSLKKLEREE